MVPIFPSKRNQSKTNKKHRFVSIDEAVFNFYMEVKNDVVGRQ